MPRKSKKEIQQERHLIAWLSAFLTIVGFLIALYLRKDDKYIMHYAKHGLVLFIGFLVAGILSWIPLAGLLFQLFVIILWVITWINALSGKKKNTFLITEIAEKIDINL